MLLLYFEEKKNNTILQKIIADKMPRRPALSEINPSTHLQLIKSVRISWFQFLHRNFGEPKLGFSPNWQAPPIPCWLRHRNNGKNLCLFYLLYYSEHFNFSWKFTIFRGFKVGTGEPPHPQYLLWIDAILPPHLCSVCFITFLNSSRANLVLQNFNIKIGQTPPPLVGTKSQPGKKTNLIAPLRE